MNQSKLEESLSNILKRDKILEIQIKNMIFILKKQQLLVIKTQMQHFKRTTKPSH
jgi:hypothetical protein